MSPLGVLNSELENYVAEFALPEFQLALKVVNQADGVRFFYRNYDDLGHFVPDWDVNILDFTWFSYIFS